MNKFTKLTKIYESMIQSTAEDGSRYTGYLKYVDHPEHIEDDMRSAFESAGTAVPDDTLLRKLAEIAQAYSSRAVSNYAEVVVANVAAGRA